MSRPRVDRAAGLLAELEQAVADLDAGDGLPTVTGDSRKLDTAPTRPGIVVLAPAPRMSFPAPGIVECAWELLCAAGPADDELQAWGRLDELVEAIRGRLGLRLTEAEPAGHTRPDNPVPLHGYRLTVTEQLDDYA